MSKLLGIYSQFLKKARPAIQRRLVSTSKKNNDTIAADVSKCKTEAKIEEKNWISYGFEINSKAQDRGYTHLLFFISISLCLVTGGFVWAYAPDYNLRDWAVREAFLELKRREAAGLPPIDPNFISPDKIVLPSDEELGDTEIII